MAERAKNKRGRYKDTCSRQIEDNKRYIGTKIGKLTIIDVSASNEVGKAALFLVQCDCGSEPYWLQKSDLLYGRDDEGDRCCKKCRAEKIGNALRQYDKSVSIGDVSMYDLLRNFKYKISQQHLTPTKDFLADLSTTDMEEFRRKVLAHFPTFERDYKRRAGLAFDKGSVASWDTLHYVALVLPYNGDEYTIAELSQILDIPISRLQMRVRRYGVENVHIILKQDKVHTIRKHSLLPDEYQIIGNKFKHISVIREATKEECESNKKTVWHVST